MNRTHGDMTYFLWVRSLKRSELILKLSTETVTQLDPCSCIKWQPIDLLKAIATTSIVTIAQILELSVLVKWQLICRMKR